MTGANFSSWFRPDQGTWSVGCYKADTGGRNKILFTTATAFGGFAKTGLYLQYGGGGQYPAYFNNELVLSPVSPNPSLTAGSYYLTAAYEVNNGGLSINGLATTTDTSGTLQTGEGALIIGADQNGAAQFNGTIRKLSFYPIRATNAQLQALTS
jgi:hypothetical protein